MRVQHLIPKGTTRNPHSTKVLDLDDLSANPPIPLDEWRRFEVSEKWSKRMQRVLIDLSPLLEDVSEALPTYCIRVGR